MKMIENIGQLKQAIADVENDVRVGVEDADTNWHLQIVSCRLEENLLLFETDYNHRIEDANQE